MSYPSSIYDLAFVEDDKLETIFVLECLPIYSYNSIVKKILPHANGSKIEKGHYNGIVECIDNTWYVNLGMNVYVLYDNQYINWKYET